LIPFGDSECREGCGYPIEDAIKNNNMCFEDNRNKNTILIINKVNDTENGLQNDENNEQERLSNNKNHVEHSEEHTKPSRYH